MRRARRQVLSDEYRSVGSRLQRVSALSVVPDLTGRVVLVTGGTSGVGRALVEQLAMANATVLFTARDAVRGARVCDEVSTAIGSRKVMVVELDLADLASIRAGAASVLDRVDRLDLLICNAAHQPDKVRHTTADGFEMTIGVNHLGHALLIQLLEGLLVSSAPSRILIVASEAHRRSRGGLDFEDLMLQHGPFRPRVAYARSKLANILYANSLAARLSTSGVRVNSAHPGSVDTPMMRANFRGRVSRRLYPLLHVLLITPNDSARGLLRVALDPALQDTTGEYFEIGVRTELPSTGQAEAARRLWSVTAHLISGPDSDTISGPASDTRGTPCFDTNAHYDGR